LASGGGCAVAGCAAVVSSQLSVVSRCAGGEEAGAFAARGREREGRGYRAAWELV